MSDLIKYIRTKSELIIFFLVLLAITLIVCIIFDIHLIMVWTLLGINLFILLIVLILGFFKFKDSLNVIRFGDVKSISVNQIDIKNTATDELINRFQSEIIERENIINLQEEKYNDATDYFSLWMHQIKTPISGISLIAQNVEDEELSRELKGEITDINDYVDMVLNYLRLGADTRDIVVENVDIDKVIKEQLRKFSNHFFAKNISIDYEASGLRFITDEKWIAFVIGQLLSNALKYSKGGTITLKAIDSKVILNDQGIGIAPEDMPRIFEKGYTGYNGRVNKKSTGIGLYLVKQVCDMIGVKISITSELNKGTNITLEFPKEKIDVRD